MAPILLFLGYFKLRVVPANYFLLSGEYDPRGPMQYFLDPRTLTQKLSDIGRYVLIAKTMWIEILHLGGRTIGMIPLLAVYLLMVGVRRTGLVGIHTAVVVSALMLAGYFCVYLVTPLNLAFHIGTSLSRLLLQLWPGFVFLFFMVVKNDTAQSSRSA